MFESDPKMGDGEIEAAFLELEMQQNMVECLDYEYAREGGSDEEDDEFLVTHPIFLLILYFYSMI